MKRMNLVMRRDTSGTGSGGDSDLDDTLGNGGGRCSGGGGSSSSISRKYECDNCHAEFPNKNTMDRHTLFCRTLADIRRGSGSVSSSTHRCSSTEFDDPLLPTPREMFILIQELTLKYNKVKDELEVMKQWAKMVGRRVGASSVSSTSFGGGGGGALAGLDFTSVTRQKRQNMEVILNEEDSEHPDLAELRPGFSEWLTSSAALSSLTTSDLNVVFHEDIVAGITAAILRVLAEHTVESGKSHLVPFKLADIKQGAFYIYDTVFKVGGDGHHINGPDIPVHSAVVEPPLRKWRAMEPCEFQLLVRTFHKLLFKEFKKWQDSNWEAQQQIMKQRQKAASTYNQMMSAFQCSPAMATCDGMFAPPISADCGCSMEDNEVKTPPVSSTDTVLSDDFAALYNKYADKMMGGALSDDTILSRVRAKLWKDMKAWRL
jgi:hypothetical protein